LEHYLLAERSLPRPACPLQERFYIIQTHPAQLQCGLVHLLIAFNHQEDVLFRGYDHPAWVRSCRQDLYSRLRYMQAGECRIASYIQNFCSFGSCALKKGLRSIGLGGLRLLMSWGPILLISEQRRSGRAAGNIRGEERMNSWRSLSAGIVVLSLVAYGAGSLALIALPQSDPCHVQDRLAVVRQLEILSLQAAIEG